jgi:hypothetical protein
MPPDQKEVFLRTDRDRQRKRSTGYFCDPELKNIYASPQRNAKAEQLHLISQKYIVLCFKHQYYYLSTHFKCQYPCGTLFDTLSEAQLVIDQQSNSANFTICRFSHESYQKLNLFDYYASWERKTIELLGRV